MLVLTRRIDESINIGHEIQITVLSVTENTIRIGIAAPLSVKVHRPEVYTNIWANGEMESKRAR